MNALWSITRNRYLFLLDMLVVGFGYILAIAVDHTMGIAAILTQSYVFVALSAAIFGGFMYVFGCYRIYWIYAGTKDYCKIILACLCAGVLICILGGFPIFHGFSFRIHFVASGISGVCVLGVRMGIRVAAKTCRILFSEEQQGEPRRVFIVGAGCLGVTLVKDVEANEKLNYQILGFIDDDSRKQHMHIEGVEVLGKVSDMKKLYETMKPEEIIFAISTITAERKREILSVCADFPCTLKIVSGFADSLCGNKSTDFIRNVGVEDLLGREAVVLDNAAIAKEIKNKVILVTGGGGSIGSELCRQIMRFSPKKVVILDIYENNAFDLENELRDQFPKADMDVVIASVRDEKRLEQVFSQYRPAMVFHAAAHKHVPMMETNAMEAVKNNVFGTYHVACCANKCNVEKFVLISTDKAVNPTNIMGATKRICEMIVQAMQTVSKTEFVAVRFGNVLNSNGSVLPRFKKQIANGGPITVTHPDITRFFMTIPEAAQLVLQAASFAHGGEIFVLDMGDPVRIYDMAKNLIRLSGLQPGKDIDIVFTGLRPGEKLYEELLMNEEGLKKTAHNKIYIGEPFFRSMDELQEKLVILKKAVESEDNDTVRAAIAKVVPTYQENRQKSTGEGIAPNFKAQEKFAPSAKVSSGDPVVLV